MCNNFTSIKKNIKFNNLPNKISFNNAMIICKEKLIRPEKESDSKCKGMTTFK